MSQEDAKPGQDRDLHEEGSARQDSESGADLSRFAIRAACELLGGVAEASAEAFRVVNSHVSAEQPNVVEGILKGNARFLEHLSQTMEKVAERFRSRPTAASEAETPKS
jgi:hypothetical protein